MLTINTERKIYFQAADCVKSLTFYKKRIYGIELAGAARAMPTGKSALENRIFQKNYQLCYLIDFLCG